MYHFSIYLVSPFPCHLHLCPPPSSQVNDLTARMEETLKQLEARFGSDLEEESNGPEKTNGSAASLDRSASAEEDGESQSKVKGPPPPRVCDI